MGPLHFGLGAFIFGLWASGPSFWHLLNHAKNKNIFPTTQTWLFYRPQHPGRHFRTYFNRQFGFFLIIRSVLFYTSYFGRFNKHRTLFSHMIFATGFRHHAEVILFYQGFGGAAVWFIVDPVITTPSKTLTFPQLVSVQQFTPKGFCISVNCE